MYRAQSFELQVIETCFPRCPWKSSLLQYRPTMAGKRLLDIAALFKASKEVVYKHVQLRQSQFKQFSQTSSLSTAFQRPYGRDTYSNVSQPGSSGRKSFSTSSLGKRKAGSEDAVPSPQSVESEVGKPRRVGLEQDHFYVQSTRNSAAEAAPNERLDVKQKKAARYPLPDGTLPPSGTSSAYEQIVDETIGPLSQVEAQKRPLENSDRKDSVSVHGSGRSSIPNPDQAVSDHNREIQRRSEAQIPSEVAKPPTSTASALGTGASALAVDHEKDVYYTPPSASGKVLSALPRTKVPKNSETSQESDPHVPDRGLNQDVFYSSANQEGSDDPQTKEQLTEEQYSEIFQSPRIKNLLRKNLESTERVLQDPKSPWRQQKKPFSTLSRKFSPSKDGVDIDVKDLAADIAKDAGTSTRTSSKVRLS